MLEVASQNNEGREERVRALIIREDPGLDQLWVSRTSRPKAFFIL